MWFLFLCLTNKRLWVWHFKKGLFSKARYVHVYSKMKIWWIQKGRDQVPSSKKRHWTSNPCCLLAFFIARISFFIRGAQNSNSYEHFFITSLNKNSLYHWSINTVHSISKEHSISMEFIKLWYTLMLYGGLNLSGIFHPFFAVSQLCCP